MEKCCFGKYQWLFLYACVAYSTEKWSTFVSCNAICYVIAYQLFSIIRIHRIFHVSFLRDWLHSLVANYDEVIVARPLSETFVRSHRLELPYCQPHVIDTFRLHFVVVLMTFYKCFENVFIFHCVIMFLIFFDSQQKFFSLVICPSLPKCFYLISHSINQWIWVGVYALCCPGFSSFTNTAILFNFVFRIELHLLFALIAYRCNAGTLFFIRMFLVCVDLFR